MLTTNSAVTIYGIDYTVVSAQREAGGVNYVLRRGRCIYTATQHGDGKWSDPRRSR